MRQTLSIEDISRDRLEGLLEEAVRRLGEPLVLKARDVIGLVPPRGESGLTVNIDGSELKVTVENG